MGNSVAGHRNQVLVIGIDGATFKVISPMIKEGRLPNIARLMAGGCHAPLQSTIPVVSPVAWTSFMTGTDPDKHGVYDFSGRVPGSYRFKINNATDRKTKPVWVILSELGKKVCVVGVTMTYPVDSVNGYMISGLGTPPAMNCTYTHPSDLHSEIERKFGKFVVVPEVNARAINRSSAEKLKYVDRVYEAFEQRTEVFNYLWHKELFDFGIIFFLDTDGISHYFWKYMDKNHRGYDPEAAREFGDVICRVYEKVDESIGKVIASLNNSCDIIVVSDHGFGALERVVFLNNWLQSMGYLRFKSEFFINRLISKIKGGETGLPNLLEAVDWKKTRAFFNGTIGNVFINLKGREPEGIVEPGADYGMLCRKLTEDLHRLVDPETGQKIVERVYTKEEIFQRGDNSYAPDLTLVMKPGYGIIGQDIFLHGLKDRGEVVADSMNWSGDHEKDGVFIACGPSFRKGESLSGARLTDIAPTVLYTMGLQVPKEMDGRVLTGIFREEPSKTRGISYSDYKLNDNASSVEYDKDEAESITKRLQDLGYLE